MAILWRILFDKVGDWRIQTLLIYIAIGCYGKGELAVSLQSNNMYAQANKKYTFLKNWWPFSLLNVIFNLSSSCIAARIKGWFTVKIKNPLWYFVWLQS